MSKQNESIQRLFDPMVQDILMKRPDNVAQFMLDWLQEYQKNQTREMQEVDEGTDDFSEEGNKMVENFIGKE